MSLAFGLAHPHWFQLSGKFNPLSLFSAGEQGIAVPDLTPGNGFLFQDSAGTTPVTAYEQPVGLILDRSKGLVLGADVLGGAGSFSSATGWTQGTGWSIGSGVATATAGFGTTLSYPATLTVGSTYRIDVQASSVTGGTLTMQLRGGTIVSAPSITADGTYTFYLTAVTGNNSVGCTKSPTFAGVIDNFIVRELPGNHIIQATSTKRPTLSARYNLLTYTETMESGWNPSNVSITTGQADVFGRTGAILLNEGAAFGNHGVTNAPVLQSNSVNYTATLYLKSGTCTKIRTHLYEYSGGVASYLKNVYWSLIDGSIYSESGSGPPPVITNVGGGWWKIVMSGTKADGNTRMEFNVQMVDDSWNPNYTGTSRTVLCCGLDFRRTIDTIGQPAYQRVGASNDYDTAGFFPYLAFDGTDDSMATAASVDFTGTDKVTLFHGVAKLSDAARGMVVELTNNAANSFQLNAPSASLGDFSFLSRGSVLPPAVQASPFSAPFNAVVACAADIAAPSQQIRLNGTLRAQNSDTQGTGNYSNSTLFVGARNNNALFFNGRLYPFFIRGAATDAGLIAQVEQYIRARMPVNF